MKSFNYIITDEIGIHARPAGLLAKEAGKYNSKLILKCGDKTGDIKRIINIMGMAIKKGNNVTVEVEGEDEDKAILALKEFFKNNL